MDINAEIGINIRTIRKRNGMTLTELADKLAKVSEIVVTSAALGRWERGEVILQAATVYYLAKALDCELYDLMPHDETTLDAQMISMLNKMSNREKQTIIYAARRWDGDSRALMEFVRMYVSIPRDHRCDVSGLAINQVTHMVKDENIELDLDVDLSMLDRMNREI